MQIKGQINLFHIIVAAALLYTAQRTNVDLKMVVTVLAVAMLVVHGYKLYEKNM